MCELEQDKYNTIQLKPLQKLLLHLMIEWVHESNYFKIATVKYGIQRRLILFITIILLEL